MTALTGGAYDLLPVAFTFILDIVALISVYIFLVLSLNIEYGYAGLPNFGKVLFVAAGAYAVGIVATPVYQWALGVNITRDELQAYGAISGGQVDPSIYNSLLVDQINLRLAHDPVIAIAVFLVPLVVAMAVGAALGVAVSYPAIRLRSDYLAICLLAFGEISRIVGNNYLPFELGERLPDPFVWSGDMRSLMATLVIALFALAVFLYARALGKSPLCRVLRAMRDDEAAASSFGRDTTKLRIRVLLVGSAVSALGGALYSFYTGAVIALSFDRITWTYWPYLMLILGGAGNYVGALSGCVIFVVLRRLINLYKEALAFLPFDPAWLDYLILGTALLLALIYRPEGFKPEEPTPTMERDELETLRAKSETEAPS